MQATSSLHVAWQLASQVALVHVPAVLSVAHRSAALAAFATVVATVEQAAPAMVVQSVVPFWQRHAGAGKPSGKKPQDGSFVRSNANDAHVLMLEHSVTPDVAMQPVRFTTPASGPGVAPPAPDGPVPPPMV
jgi:hypothetical protein